MNESSFGDITFEEFDGENIKLIHNYAFGKTAKKIKTMKLNYGFVNHRPPQYDIWKVFNGLSNVQVINVHLNITEIPQSSVALEHLNTFKINTPNKITIRKRAFYHFDGLSSLKLTSKIKKIEEKAFAMKIRSENILKIRFSAGKLNGTEFQIGSFNGIQRPVQITFHDSKITFLDKAIFKSVLDHPHSIIVFDDSLINCTHCKNQWLIRDKNNKQVQNAKCVHDKHLTLFNSEINEFHTKNCLEYVSLGINSIASQYLVIFLIIITFCINYNLSN